MRTCILFVMLLLSVAVLHAEVIVLNGVYQGKDLYVKNPTTSSGVGFCIFEIVVNGQITADEVNVPAFAIDLGSWKFKMGDPIEIVIRCKEDCAVKIINPEVIYPTSTFEVVSIQLSPEGQFVWKTDKEAASIPFSVEQFKWNRWVKVGEVKGLGVGGQREYVFQANLHSGVNQLRIQQVDHKGAHFSDEVKTMSATPAVTIVSTKVAKNLDFSMDTDFEIYSEFGALVKTGRAKSIDMSNFPKGKYYVNFDNKTGVAVDKK
jgi:hypothetical protein